VAFSGGPVSTIATLAGAPSLSGISWGRDGILVAVPGAGAGIVRVNPDGGTLERVVAVGQNEAFHGPQMLPDGRTVLLTVARNVADDRWDNAQIVAHSLADGTRRVLIERGSDGRYVPSGHVLYAVGGTVYAVPFDVRTLTVTGKAVSVIAGVRRAIGAQTGATQLAVSETGTLAYVPGPATTSVMARSLVLGDGRGDAVPLKVPPAVYVHPRISPDGRVLAVGRNEGPSSDIWTYDLAGKTEIKRLTFGGGSRFPVWSADSRRVTFQAARDGGRAIWWQPVDGGTAERLTNPAKDEEHVPESWSRDGTRLLFSVRKGPTFSLWVFTLSGKKAEPFGSVVSQESPSASFSPDGRWVAYAYTEQAGGSLSPNRGIFVEPYTPTGEKHQAPKTLLDYHPLWAPDGKSILYIPGSSRSTVSVPVTTTPSIAFGTPVELPRSPLPGLLSLDVRGYDVLPDGRFVSVSQESQAGAGRPELRVVLNWFEELKRLVPVAK
jgi:Tol biopolymer transport system component